MAYTCGISHPLKYFYALVNTNAYRVNAVCLPRGLSNDELLAGAQGYSDVDNKVLYLAGYGKYGYGRIPGAPGASMQYATVSIEYHGGHPHLWTCVRLRMEVVTNNPPLAEWVS